MSVEQRLRRQYDDLKQQWEILNDRIAELGLQKISGTRIEEDRDHSSASADAPVLTKSTIQEITVLLTPLMKSEQERRALLTLALGHEASLLNRIEFSGPTHIFILNMLTKLIEFGEVEPDIPALWVLLETVRAEVGVDRQKRIDALRKVVNPSSRNYDHDLEPAIQLQKIIDEKTAEREKIEQRLLALETRLEAIQGDASRSIAVPKPLPQRTTTGRLLFESGATVRQTRLFADNQVTLGRPMTDEADLWLTLLPLNNPEHHSVMDSMSRKHALIGWEHHPLIKDGGSRNFTFVNGEPLATDWRILRDGDEIAFQRKHVLVLRACCEPGQWLRLDRLNNGADEENYLLLQGRATIGGEKSAIPLEAQSAADDVLAELSHVQGGFVITSWSASIIVNDTGIDSATSVGLSDGDRVILEDRSFIFYAGAYDNGVPGLR